MSDIEVLRNDHDALREAIEALRAALVKVSYIEIVETRYRLLAGLVATHLRREGAVLRPHAGHRLAVAKSGVECASPDVLLRELELLFSAWRATPTSILALHICRLLDELRERLAQEERELFPVLEADVPVGAV